nr:DNA polymerase III subunit chi [Halorhodospira halophila]
MDAVSRVDFYILDGPGEAPRERFACRLAEKAYENGYGVLLLTEDDEQTERLDALLWTFRQGSFVPHATLAARDGEPVAVGGDEHAADDAVLINLTDRTPATWQARQRIAEVVDQREAVLRASRQRYRIYKEAGCEPHTHRIEEGRR